MDKVKLAIVGMGRMGITHYSIINSNPYIEIESVSDSSGVILSLMEKYFKVKTFKDYNDLLEQMKPDAILVCTPPNLHFPIIKKASEKGIHAFVEKPFTTKLTQATELMQLYARTNLVNQVGYVNRFNDVFVKVKELLDNRVIGNIVRFKSEMFSCTITKSDESSGWRSSRDSGGGAVFEMASHAIDLVNFLIGKPDKVVGSSLSYIFSKKVEDAVFSTFIYKNGITGNLNVNWSDTSYRKPTNRLEIFGDSGRILADQHSLKIYLNKPNEHYQFQSGWNTLYVTDVFKPVPFYVRGNEFTRQLYHFVECIQDRQARNQCTFADGVNTLEVIENIFTDYQQNGRI
jgi:predicted dehydrogenase